MKVFKVFIHRLPIWVLLLSVSVAGAAEIELSIVQNGYRLRYAKADGPGTMTLYQSASPSFTTQVLVASAAFASTNWIMDIPYSALPLDYAFIRTVVLRGDNSEDEPDVDEPVPPVILLTQGVPLDASGTQTVVVSFALASPAGESVPYTGSLRLGANGMIPVTFSPEVLQFANGFAQVELTLSAPTRTELNLVAAATGLESDYLLNREIIPSFRIGGTTPLLPSTLALAVASTEVAPDDGNWHHPLGSNAGVRVTGTFGEHRKNTDYIHEGYDLSPAPATVATKVVQAARSGLVTWIGNLEQGMKVVIDHGDGWYSAYLHLQPPLAVTVGQNVARDATLSRGMNGSAAHLHFEVRRGAPGLKGVSSPGEPINQIEVPAMFSLPPTPSSQIVKAFGITSHHPAEIPFKPGYFEPAEKSGPVYVFFRAAHLFTDLTDPLRPRIRNLALYGIQFIPTFNYISHAIVTSSKSALAEFAVTSRKDPDRGFAAYETDQLATSKPYYAFPAYYFPYWFRWTPETYQGGRGPQSVRLLMVDYYGRQETVTFTIGPQLRVRADSHYLDPVLGHLQRYRVAVDYYLGREGLVQPDRYHIALSGTGNWEHSSVAAFDSELMNNPLGSGTTMFYLLRPMLDRTPFSLSAESLVAPGVKDEGTVTPTSLGVATVVRVVEIEVNGSVRATNTGGITSYQNLAVGDNVKLTAYLMWRRGSAPPGEPTSGPIPDEEITTTWQYTGLNPLPTKQLAPSRTRNDGAFEVFFSVGDSDFKDNSSSSSWTIRPRFAGGTANGFEGSEDTFFCAAHR